MKKHLSRAMLVAFAVAILVPCHSFSQSMRNWTWRPYMVKFQMPANWTVKKSTGTVFIAKGPHDVTMKIQPLNSSNAKGAAMTGYNSYSVVLNKSILRQRYLRSTPGLTRFVIVGQGQSNRTKSPVNFGVIGLKNSKTGKSLYVRFWWKKQYHGSMINVLNNIADSFRAM